MRRLRPRARPAAPAGVHEDALRAIMEALQSRLDDAHGALDRLLTPSASPMDAPQSVDAHSQLDAIRRYTAALEWLDWPPDRPAAHDREEP
jgi:ribosomal protein S12 methylthiotransferase accessory factor YcaO